MTAPTPEQRQYRCNHCGKTVIRNSDKRWIKSFCEEAGKTTRLWMVTQ